MIAALFSWLGGRIASPLATLAALVFAAGFLWQTARIDGAPFVGGGLKAQVATLEKDIAGRELAQARAEAAVLAARQELMEAGAMQARAHAVNQAATEQQIQTVIREVPVYVTQKADRNCVVPWAFVRLLDAAASGAELDTVRAAIAPGQPDDAASDVTLSEALALLAADFGIARQNAGQLEHLEKAMAADQ